LFLQSFFHAFRIFSHDAPSANNGLMPPRHRSPFAAWTSPTHRRVWTDTVPQGIINYRSKKPASTTDGTGCKGTSFSGYGIRLGFWAISWSFLYRCILTWRAWDLSVQKLWTVQGRRFEGMTVAKASGWFTYNSATPLQGPNLIATATDKAGNTSQFSSPRTLPQVWIL